MRESVEVIHSPVVKVEISKGDLQLPEWTRLRACKWGASQIGWLRGLPSPHRNRLHFWRPHLTTLHLMSLMRSRLTDEVAQYGR